MALGYGALVDVPDDGGLDDLGEDPVLVHLDLGEVEVVHVPVEGVLLAPADESVLQGAFDGDLPCPDSETAESVKGVENVVYWDCRSIRPPGTLWRRPSYSVRPVLNRAGSLFCAPKLLTYIYVHEGISG